MTETSPPPRGTLREAREQAYWHHWRLKLREYPREGLPAFLDELERLDAEHAAGTGNGTVIGQYTTAEAPGEFLTLGGRRVELTPEQQAKIRAALDASNGPHVPFPLEDPAPVPAKPARPAARRRPARGGTP